MNAAHATAVIATSALAGVASTWATRRFAVAHGIVNHPNPLVPQHHRPVAYLGGVAVFLALAATLALVAFARHLGWIEVSGIISLRYALPATMFLVLGVVDDLRVLSPATKFAAQVLIAALAASLGLAYEFTGVRLIDAGASAFLVLTLVNAFNLTDVCDGLVGAISVVLFAAALTACADGDVTVIAGVLGACAGFLVFNGPPASIFLGDAGSHLLGFLAAAALLSLPTAGQGAATDVARLLLLAGVPLFELALLIAVRTQKGIAWWRGSPDHFALRLQARGLSRAQTDLLACAAAAVLAAAGLKLPSLGGPQRALVVGVALLAMALSWRALLWWEVPPKPPLGAVVPAAPPVDLVERDDAGAVVAAARVES
jgi:UDP-GlcNAc:undecaprenyl-phosphate GlcNAc-1-phosphate transferase